MLVVPSFGAFHTLINSKSVSVRKDEKVQKIAKIVVADFDGPEPQTYRVTENILAEIRQKTSPYKDVQVLSLNRPIKEQDGKSAARKIGQEEKADIVIWGWYTSTKQKAQASVHFEVIDDQAISSTMNNAVQGFISTVPQKKA